MPIVPRAPAVRVAPRRDRAREKQREHSPSRSARARWCRGCGRGRRRGGRAAAHAHELTTRIGSTLLAALADHPRAPSRRFVEIRGCRSASRQRAPRTTTPEETHEREDEPGGLSVREGVAAWRKSTRHSRKRDEQEADRESNRSAALPRLCSCPAGGTTSVPASVPSSGARPRPASAPRSSRNLWREEHLATQRADLSSGQPPRRSRPVGDQLAGRQPVDEIIE